MPSNIINYVDGIGVDPLFFKGAFEGQSLAVGFFNSQETGSRIGADTVEQTIADLTDLSVTAFDAATGATYLTSYSDTRSNTLSAWDGVNQVLADIGIDHQADIDLQSPIDFIQRQQGQADQNRIEADLTYDLWNEQVGTGITVDNGNGTFELTDNDVAASEYLREVVTVETGRVPAIKIHLKKDDAATGSPLLQIAHDTTTNAILVDPTNGNTRISSGDAGALVVESATHPVLGDTWLITLTSDNAVTATDNTVDFRIYPARGDAGQGSISISDTNVGTISIADAANYQNYAGSFGGEIIGKVSESQWEFDLNAYLDYLIARYDCPILLSNLGHRDGTESSTSNFGQNVINGAYARAVASNPFVIRGAEFYLSTLDDGVHPNDGGYVTIANGVARNLARRIYGRSDVNDVGIEVGAPTISGDDAIIPTILQDGTTYNGNLSRTSGVADLTPSGVLTEFIEIYVNGSKVTPTSQVHNDGTVGTNSDAYVLGYGSGVLGDADDLVEVYMGYGSMYNLDLDVLVLDSDGLPTRIAKWTKVIGDTDFTQEY